jgi:HNH endonuclease
MHTYHNRKRTTEYRRIYIAHFGPIPRESNGRSYEIHHIDGDHTNNDPSNLVAITLQEHYDIHYARGDWGACYLMAVQRMNKTPEELSELASKRNSLRNKKLVEEGTHNFLGGYIQKERNRKYLENGTHHLLGPAQNLKRIQDNNHNFIGPSQNKSMYANGVHPSQSKLCCLGCKKVTHKAGFVRSHKNCTPIFI